MEKIKKWKRTYVAVICLTLFILVTILVCLNATTSFDEGIYQFVHGNHNDILDFFFIHYTKLGNTIPTMIVALVIFLVLSKKDKIIFGSSMISTVGINQLLKFIIRRPRPPMERRLVTLGGFSYPSGHTMVSLCLYGVLIYFVITKVKNKALKILLATILTIMILLIGISRIYVGVHYPSDVLGGFLCSTAIIIVSITACNHYLKGE